MKVFLKDQAINQYPILCQVLPLFPSGFPVTSAIPERDLAFYWDKSPRQKLLYQIKYFLKTGKVWQLSSQVDPPFYVLDSKALSLEQNQALLKLLKQKRWHNQIPAWVNPDDPVANSLKILARDVEKVG